MKSFELQNLLLETLDANTSEMPKATYTVHARKLVNLRTLLALTKVGKLSVVRVLIDSKDLCLSLQEQRWTIANASDETGDRLIGFKRVSEVRSADLEMFTFISAGK